MSVAGLGMCAQRDMAEWVIQGKLCYSHLVLHSSLCRTLQPFSVTRAEGGLFKLPERVLCMQLHIFQLMHNLDMHNWHEPLCRLEDEAGAGACYAAAGGHSASGRAHQPHGHNQRCVAGRLPQHPGTGCWRISLHAARQRAQPCKNPAISITHTRSLQLGSMFCVLCMNTVLFADNLASPVADYADQHHSHGCVPRLHLPGQCLHRHLPL